MSQSSEATGSKMIGKRSGRFQTRMTVLFRTVIFIGCSVNSFVEENKEIMQ